MNLIDGEVKDGVFTGRGFRVEGFGNANAPHAVLGVRPEDAQVTTAKNGGANLTAPIYSVELTGDATLVSVYAGDRLVTMKADKNFVGDFDQEIGVRVSPGQAFLFDRESEKRVDVA
jgi:multiple sugar transport system ATP-binding protein